jgi:hypothetical protein
MCAHKFLLPVYQRLTELRDGRKWQAAMAVAIKGFASGLI